MLNFPTMLTLSRVLVIPAVMFFMCVPDTMMSRHAGEVVATALFVLAAVTDWFDGRLARAWNQTSAFGAIADQLADKLLVSAALILLVHVGRLNPAVAVIMVMRELTVSGLREWMAKAGHAAVVAVGAAGKVKTTCQLVAIPFLICQFEITGRISSTNVGTVLMWTAAGLSVWSMCVYLKAAWTCVQREGSRATGSRVAAT
jgi:CDP-diacylglycerol--glycerol-3-phosphate 3-phosphatidyltransferase